MVEIFLLLVSSLKLNLCLNAMTTCVHFRENCALITNFRSGDFFTF